MVRNGYLFADELRDALDHIRDASGAQAEVLLIVNDVSSLAEHGDLTWIQTALADLLAAGGRIQVLKVSNAGAETGFVVEQPFTSDPGLARRAVMRSADAHAPTATSIALEQIKFSVGAARYVVSLGTCNLSQAAGARIREWAHAQQVVFDGIEYKAPPWVDVYDQDGNPHLDKGDAPATPRLRDLRTIIPGDLTFVPLGAGAEGTRVTLLGMLQTLAMDRRALDVFLTFEPDATGKRRQATLNVVAESGKAFLQAHPEHRIALGVGKGEIPLPLTRDPALLEAALKDLERRHYAEQPDADALFRAAEKLDWSEGARRVIVAAPARIGGGFRADSVDWLAARKVGLQFVDGLSPFRADSWEPRPDGFRGEHCIAVEADAGATWPGSRAPVATCDLGHSLLAPRDPNDF